MPSGPVRLGPSFGTDGLVLPFGGVSTQTADATVTDGARPLSSAVTALDFDFRGTSSADGAGSGAVSVALRPFLGFLTLTPASVLRATSSGSA